jgi:tetratricopeptide (TPR) repeat protein
MISNEEKPGPLLLVAWEGADFKFFVKLRETLDFSIGVLAANPLPFPPAPPFQRACGWGALNRGVSAWASAETEDSRFFWDKLTGHRIISAGWPEMTIGRLADDERDDCAVSPGEIEVGTIRLLAPRFAELDQINDPAPGVLAHLLAETFTVHAEATRLLETPDWDLGFFRYPGIFRGYEAFGRYLEPLPPGVSPTDAELLSDVVPGLYRLHHLMLSRLLQLAPKGTRVILFSPSGYALLPERNAPPSLRREEALSTSPGIFFDSRPSSGGRGTPNLASLVLSHFGITNSPPPPSSLPKNPSLQSLWNHARVYHHLGHLHDTASVLLTLRERQPAHLPSAVLLISILLQLRLLDEGRAQLASELARFPESKPLRFFKAIFDFVDGQEEPLTEIEKEAANLSLTSLDHLWLAKVFEALKLSDRAAPHFEKLLQKNPADHTALNGLANIRYHQRELETAEELARRSFTIDPTQEEAAFVLGLSCFAWSDSMRPGRFSSTGVVTIPSASVACVYSPSFRTSLDFGKRKRTPARPGSISLRLSAHSTMNAPPSSANSEAAKRHPKPISANPGSMNYERHWNN